MKKISDFYKILDTRYKNALVFLVVVLFLNSILEMLLIGVLYPLISLLINPETNFESKSVNEILSYLNSYTDNPNMIFNLLILVILIFVFKFLFNVITLYSQNKYAFSLLQNLSYKLFSSYISKSYLDLSKENSSYLIRNLTSNLNTFVNGVNAFINIISELLIILSIAGLLLLIDFKIAITVMIFFSMVSLIFLLLTKFRINKLSNQRFLLEGKKIKKINEDLNGLIDIRLSGNISFFKNIYFKTENLLKENYIKLQILLGLPKIWIEFITIGVFIIFTYFIINSTNAFLIDYIALIGLYALSAFKMMPSFNRILINFNTVKFTKKIFLNILNELKKLKYKDENFKNDKIYICKKISIKNLNFFYEKKKIIFKKINLTFKKNKTYGIYGSSGVGKSTLINLMLGTLKPTSGKIIYNNNIDISKNLSSWQESISYVPQKPYFFDDSILKNIAIGVNLDEIDLEKINFCLDLVNLKDKVNQLKKKYNTKLGEVGKKFSGGELQRIAIARAIYKNGNILILDEATSALDAKNESIIISRIKKNFGNKIIIIISHKKKLIHECDYIIKL
jgi:ABC-type multidrug transport system fused ATPase/permease subunit